MTDGITPETTGAGQSMEAAIEEMRQKLREIEKGQLRIIDDAKRRGVERSKAEWHKFREKLRELFANDDTVLTRRKCNTCGYSWMDKYGKPDCPKCFAKMDDGIGSPKKKGS